MSSNEMNAQTPRFFNRELSWLKFNERVLGEAQNADNPLLERLKFIAITVTNLDEFYMVRVGGLQLLQQAGKSKLDPSGMSPSEQLAAIDGSASSIVAETYRCLRDEIEPALSQHGVHRLRGSELNEEQLLVLHKVFEQEILPVFSPMAVSIDREFPTLANLALNLCVRLAPASDKDSDKERSKGKGKNKGKGKDKNKSKDEGTVASKGEPRYAIIPFQRSDTRLLTLPSERGYSYILLEDALEYFVADFFPGIEIEQCIPFRISRNADMAVREDEAGDLMLGLQEILAARRESECVRLEISDDADDATSQFLMDVLETDRSRMTRIKGPLDLSCFFVLSEIQGFDALRNPEWPPQASPDVDPKLSMFENIAARDILLHHPYDRFDSVVRLLQEAAEDPDVLAIKQTLYRTSKNSPIVAALRRAAENGKHVTVVVELKARFDEQRNIEWARHLEQANVQVIYGVQGLKTHAKACMVVRREPSGVQRYLHFGTGNYNENTAKMYGDISLLTCDEPLGHDVSSFFNALTGYSHPMQFRKLEAAPLTLRDKLLELISGETERKRQGQQAHIVAKLNSLVDPEIIERLYEASQAGVSVKLNVRGVCCLRPGVLGLSKNIQVVSIVDRYLEHARIIYFYHGGDEQVFISSADWMQRNLDRRVELLTPIDDSACRQRLVTLLDTYFQDNVKAKTLQPDGNYSPVRGDRPYRCQSEHYREACDRVRAAKDDVRNVFVPHRAEEES
jgi:polyphosphate kinase